MERVLPSAEVKEKIAALAVGLAADCDAPENDVDQIMHKNLSGANALPFVGFISHDGKWVEGFSGFRDTEDFVKVLDTADRSPLLNATPAVQKKIAALAATAQKAAERGDWKAVLKASRDAAKMVGRCPERATLAGLVTQAREWAKGQLDAVARDAGSGGDLAALRKTLGDLKTRFSGEPEGAEADAGLKALQRLSQIVEAEAGEAPPQGMREKAAAEFKDTRWAQVFEKGAPAEAPPEEK